jgi:hypothetical protein
MPVATETCLPSRWLVMDFRSDYAIPAFSDNVTILFCSNIIPCVFRDQTPETLSVTTAEASKTNNCLFAHAIDMFGVHEVWFLAALVPLPYIFQPMDCGLTSAGTDVCF